MFDYLLKTLILLIFSFFIIFSYYFWNSAHIENFDWYISYIVIIWLIYWCYKFFQIELSEKIASFSMLKILWYFLLHLLVLCFLFFNYSWFSLFYWVVLFFKIIFYLLLPIIIVITSLWFWKKITSYLKYVSHENSIYKFILSFWIWFFSFVSILDIVWLLWFYNLYLVFLILAGFVTFSYKELTNILKWIIDYKIEFEIEEWSYLKLVTTEFLFIVSTLLLSVNLINIVRPFPIWWDDLWVYMNFPHLMAEAGSIISLWWMYSWQTLTGIWYMFWSPTQAFFLNNIWGFMSFVLVVLITSDLLKVTDDTHKKSFINIPMLIWTMFIAMPMIVFQQAKDMKLDAGLFFVSITALYLLFKYYINSDKHKYLEKVKWFINDNILHKTFDVHNLLIIFIIGLLIGFAFTIKFTTVLFICAIFWLITFVRIWLIGFIWYIFILFAIFTKGNLWGIMNVVVNPDKIVWFEDSFFLISWTIWFVLFIYGIFKNKWVIKKFFLELGVILLWIIVAVLPWVGNHIYDSYPQISLWSILSWKPDSFSPDYTKIYTQSELNDITQKQISQSMWSEWTTINEDFWRYFGYEKWINNYIKLPWNLTMQKNQWWEFTDIWFLFLALLPCILLFLPYRKKYYWYFIVIILLLEIFIFYKSDVNLIDNSKLSVFSSVSDDVKSSIFQRNDSVFSRDLFNKDIYDINVSNYITKSDIKSIVNEENSFWEIEKKAIDAFYLEIKNKVLDPEIWKDLSLVKNSLLNKDFELVKELHKLNTGYSTFHINITSLSDLEEIINKNWLEKYKESLIDLWKHNRTLNQAISDFFASYNLPYWYILILLAFFIPVIVLFFILDTKYPENHKIFLFKLNLVFAVFYTFLWNISAFWIVWYGIVMYFSMFLAIAIWLYYLSSYTDEKNEKEFFIRLFWSLVIILIVSVYIFNSVFPHTFTNLKTAWYDDFKTWKISVISAPYDYHQEYLKILFYLNIDQNKKEEFLIKYIRPEIKKAVTWIEKMDIYDIKNILEQIIKTQPLLTNHAKFSLMDIYANISNPEDEFKNETIIYRIWTFLKYHISENNIRLFEDSLIFTYNDYIYNSDKEVVVENFKKLWVKYLLADLNAATIDKDERHNLTTRYEKLLDLFKSDKMELIETDSICLKIAIEDYNKSKKTNEDDSTFITIAWVNHESYTSDWKMISRNDKYLECLNRVYYLINNWKIDTTNYNYLYNLYNYINQNKESYKTQEQLYPLFQQQISRWYKALFELK